jgi:hypothetical protein
MAGLDKPLIFARRWVASRFEAPVLKIFLSLSRFVRLYSVPARFPILGHHPAQKIGRGQAKAA